MVVGYGKKIRAKVRTAHIKSTTRYQCPKCSRNAIKRDSAAIWQCTKCDSRFASGTYDFR